MVNSVKRLLTRINIEVGAVPCILYVRKRQMGIRICFVVDWILELIYLLQRFRRSPDYRIYIYAAGRLQ